VAIVLAAKALATAATFGSGAVGGVFTPTLCLGSACGYLVGLGAHALLPHASAEAHAYALVGMGACLAATTQAPLMAILIVFDITLDYGIVLPLMLACVVAYHTAHSTDGRSIYADALKRKRRDDLGAVLARGTIAGLVKADPLSVREDARFADLVQAFTH